MNHSACFRPVSMVDHSAVLAAIEESSRNTRMARSRYQGLAKRSKPFCRSTANGWEAARE